jgi:hypothetical protein
MHHHFLMRKTGLTPQPGIQKRDLSVLEELIRLNQEAGLEPGAIVNMPAREWFEKIAERLRAA